MQTNGLNYLHFNETYFWTTCFHGISVEISQHSCRLMHLKCIIFRRKLVWYFPKNVIAAYFKRRILFAQNVRVSMWAAKEIAIIIYASMPKTFFFCLEDWTVGKNQNGNGLSYGLFILSRQPNKHAPNNNIYNAMHDFQSPFCSYRYQPLACLETHFDFATKTGCHCFHSVALTSKWRCLISFTNFYQQLLSDELLSLKIFFFSFENHFHSFQHEIFKLKKKKTKFEILFIFRRFFR